MPPPEPKKPTPPDAPSSPPTSPPDAPKPTAQPAGPSVADLQAKIAKYAKAETGRALIIRRLAAAVLTPADEADGGRARKQAIRDLAGELIATIFMDEA